MQDLTITLIQTSLFWEDKKRNLENFNYLISNLKDKQDLIILPEMFTTGFTMNPERLAEPMDGDSVEWMSQKAAETNCTITGSLMIKEKDQHFNRLIWMTPDGKMQTYDKRHLFRLGNEHNHFNAGEKPLITELKGWKIKPLICYDLRFPVWSKNNFVNNQYEYDLLIYMANWPSGRSFVWKNLLVARAIENQAYSIGVNRIGNDGTGLDYSGDSMIVSSKGNILHDSKNYEEVMTKTLLHKPMERFREMFTVGLDWDRFNVEN